MFFLKFWLYFFVKIGYRHTCQGVNILILFYYVTEEEIKTVEESLGV